jgi:hypothetical protein
MRLSRRSLDSATPRISVASTRADGGNWDCLPPDRPSLAYGSFSTKSSGQRPPRSQKRLQVLMP